MNNKHETRKSLINIILDKNEDEQNQWVKDDDRAAVFIIWAVAALLITLFMAVVYSEEAHASRTLHLVDQYHTSDALVCVYSDGRDYVNVERPRGSQHCPYTYVDYD